MKEQRSLHWLQRLKDESWEAELLISAVSIFAILNAFTPLDWLVNFFISHLPPEQYFYGFMISFGGYLALGILGAFFVIHLGLRAYWIGLVGLNSVFPDYSLKDSAYSEIYTRKMSETLPKLPATISVLDEVCSVTFSAAFAFLLLYLNISLLSGILLGLYNVAIGYSLGDLYAYLMMAFALVFVLLMIFTAVANLKAYKDNEGVQVWYYHIAIWSNKLLLGPLYRYLLQITMIFGSNFKKKKSIVMTMLVMVVFGIAFAMFQLFQSNITYLSREVRIEDKHRLYPHHYRVNNLQNRFLVAPEIQAETIDSSVIELFVPLFSYETGKLSQGCGLDEEKSFGLDAAQRQARWERNLICYAKSVQVMIDDNWVDVEFIKTDHAITGQFGLFAFVDVANIESGQHHLSVVKKLSSDEEKTNRLPFYLSTQ